MNTMFRMNHGRVLVLVLLFLLAFPLGCSGPGDQPELGLVSGTIKLDGIPLSGVAVVFQPASGRPARGKTNDQGQYELTYIRQTKGAKVGPNRVEIAPSEEGEEGEGAEEPGDDMPQKATAKPKSGKPMVPARYNLQSELKVDVKAGENTFDFNLQSK